MTDVAQPGRWRGALVRATATVGSFTLLSRVAGFVRDVMIAGLLGAGPLADAFFVAFKLPNFLRRLFAEGAFNAGFVPLFARTLEAEGRETARGFAEEAQAIMVAVLATIVVLAIVFMPALMRVVAPGFDVDGPTYTAAVDYSRITFCYLLFISLVALYGGVLNSLGIFGPPAAAPIVLNLSLISALVLSVVWFDMPALALAWGVAAAGLLQLLWLVFSLQRAGIILSLRWPRITPRIRRLFALILPGALGAGVAQISLVADVFFASPLAPGAVSYLYYADRLVQLPLGVIGVAIGTALLPLLSRQLRAGEREAALASQNRALELALLLTVPAALALGLLAVPIIGTLFERGAFGPEETTQTAAALSAYALGLPAYVLVKVLAPGFFAREDTKTPVQIAVVCLPANLALVVTLIGPLAHVGIALATALSAWLNAVLLGVFLRRRGLLELDLRLRARVPRIIGASLGMALILWLLADRLASLPDLIALVLLVGAGGLAFLALAQVSGALAMSELRGLLSRRRA